MLSTVLRAVLGAVFLLAGAAKLRDPGWVAGASALRVPPALARPVPWVEVVLGALVVAGVGLPWTVALLTLLLVAFTAVVAAAVVRGERVRCACFGAWSAAPAGWADVLRNAALLGLAAAVLVTA